MAIDGQRQLLSEVIVWGVLFRKSCGTLCEGNLDSRCPLSLKLHMWLALKNRLWTADILQKRGLPHPPQCPLCSQDTETGEHLLVQCVFAREVWHTVLQWRGLQGLTPGPDSTAAQWWTDLAAALPCKKMKKEVSGLVILTARFIWLE